MTFKEYLNTSQFKLIDVLNNLSTILDNTVAGVNYDTKINQITAALINDYIFTQYYDFNLLYPASYIDRALPAAIFGSFQNITLAIRQLQITSSDYYAKLENWSYNTLSNNINETGYDGYDATGVFNKSSNITNSKNGDVFAYIIQMNQPLNNLLNILAEKIEALLQTIYIPK